MIKSPKLHSGIEIHPLIGALEIKNIKNLNINFLHENKISINSIIINRF